MAKDTLKLEISAPLQKALGLSGSAGTEFDYFALLGVVRGSVSAEAVENNLRERTRALRKWQNSPQFGREVVRLLPVLHRAAKILQDDRRREAYRHRLDQLDSGQEEGDLERFEELARVALVGNTVTPGDRLDLEEFARAHGLSAQDTRRVIEKIREEYRAAAPPPPAESEDWEFRLAGEGEEAFLLTLAGIRSSGAHLEAKTEKLVETGLGYGLDLAQARNLVLGQQRSWFRDLADLVAGQGALSEQQVQMLLRRAPSFGLSEEEAYHILADYSLSAMLSDSLMRELGLSETFGMDDIEQILEESVATRRRAGLWTRLTQTIPDGAGKMILGALLLGAVGFGAYVVYQGRTAGISTVTETRDLTASPPVEQGDTVPVATPTPTPAETPPPLPVILPDPPDGLLPFDPQQAGDPPAFRMLIHEVTCDEYAEYLQATLDPPPPGWPASRRVPLGLGPLPITNLTWAEANHYLQWLALRRGWDAKLISLPSLAEYRRATRGRTIRSHGDPQRAGYWDLARLGSKNGLERAMTTPWDRIHHAGLGQIYDLLGNAEEWGQDSQGSEQVILGGSYMQKQRDFNLMQPRWSPPGDRNPARGFRFVIHAPPPEGG